MEDRRRRIRQGGRNAQHDFVTEANSEKGISDIRAMIAKTGGNMVLNVDPNNTPDARPIVEACFKAKVYVVTWWNKPADLHPWDFDPYYISHIGVRRRDQRRLHHRGALQDDWMTKAVSSRSAE